MERMSKEHKGMTEGHGVEREGTQMERITIRDIESDTPPIPRKPTEHTTPEPEQVDQMFRFTNEEEPSKSYAFHSDKYSS